MLRLRVLLLHLLMEFLLPYKVSPLVLLMDLVVVLQLILTLHRVVVVRLLRVLMVIPLSLPLR